MISSCGRFVIVYNGEIYSHGELLRELEYSGRRVEGSSDTAVLLEACAEWGVAKVLPRLIGMFAFALYDKKTCELTLVRDRLGIKPIYWGIVDNLFLFGSELKALRVVPTFLPRLDRNALSTFLRHNYIPAPYTIYQGIRKLEPGTMLAIRPGGEPRLTRYWDLRALAGAALRHPATESEPELLERLESLLTDAVRRRLVTDVPIGALLSGGIDSSLVTALMAETAEGQIKTFSIGFQEQVFNEAPYARAVANHLGTDHTELYVEAKDALGFVGQLSECYDEPFADSSQIPTALVCALTRRHVTVVLSGDGGDELFAGYGRYAVGLDAMAKAIGAGRRSPRLPANALFSRALAQLDRIGARLAVGLRSGSFSVSLRRFAGTIQGEDPDGIYRQMLSHWQEPDELVLGGRETKGILWDSTLCEDIPDFLDRMQLLDTLTYLPDDILTKVDRASMWVALEARVPLLDHRIVELAWRLPRRMKMRDGVSKWALRQILEKRVPRALIDRPKMGFGMPVSIWLRGPLREWAEHLLDGQRLAGQGLLAPDPIRERWNAHQGGADWGYPLWNVLLAEAWIEANPEVTL